MILDKSWLIGILTAALVFVVQIVANILISHYLKKHLEKRDKEQDAKEKAKIDYDQVSLEVNIASAKLSYALAMAIKRGSPNGEVEAGIAAYSEAMEKLQGFLRNQALYSIK